MSISSIVTRGLKFGLIATAGWSSSSTAAASPLVTGGFGSFSDVGFIVGGGMIPYTLQPQGFDNLTQSMGNPSLLSTEAVGSSTFPTLTFFIQGTSREQYVAAGQSALRISRSVNSRCTATFQTIDTAGTYAPSAHDSIDIFHNSTLVFSGTIERVESFFEPGTGCLKANVSCNDAGAYLDRRAVGRYYSLGTGGLGDIITADIVTQDLAGTGITFRQNPLLSPYVDTKIFYYVTVGEALRQIAQLGDLDFYVNVNKELFFYSYSGGGYDTAPGSFGDATANWRNLKVTKSRGKFANHVIAKGSKTLSSQQTDTFAGHAGVIYVTSQPMGLNTIPTVTVNDVEQNVVMFGKPGDPRTISNTQYDFYVLWGDTQQTVIYNYNYPALTSSDTVKISYPGKLPYIGEAKDDSSISTYGDFTYIYEAGDVTSKAELDAIASGLLSKLKQTPTQISLQTDDAGYFPAQLVAFSNSDHGVSDNFLITSANSQEIVPGDGQIFFRTDLEMANKDYQQQSDPTRYIGEIIRRSREKINTVAQEIGFVVAGTVEGLTNPGLSTGLKPAIKTAQKDGVANRVTLVFESLVAGASTSSDIVIDILKNGISIFEDGKKLTLPAGQSSIETYAFISDPLQVSAGDQFQFEVISADTAAKDGDLTLYVLG